MSAGARPLVAAVRDEHVADRAGPSEERLRLGERQQAAPVGGARALVADDVRDASRAAAAPPAKTSTRSPRADAELVGGVLVQVDLAPARGRRA